jgi:hypothetical protein
MEELGKLAGQSMHLLDRSNRTKTQRGCERSHPWHSKWKMENCLFSAPFALQPLVARLGIRIGFSATNHWEDDVRVSAGNLQIMAALCDAAALIGVFGIHIQFSASLRCHVGHARSSAASTAEVVDREPAKTASGGNL